MNRFSSRVEEVCSLVTLAVPPLLGSTHWRTYLLEDGTLLRLSQEEWFDLYDRAAKDPTWRKENHALLKAIGIIICTRQLVTTADIIDMTTSKTLCFGNGPGVIDPAQ